MSLPCAVSGETIEVISQSIEVSGWDAEGQFFAEIADLEFGGSGAGTTRLCHRVESGSLVFVRSLENDQQPHEKSHPIPNEAQVTSVPDYAGRCRIRLTPCQPRRLPRR